MDDLDDLTKPQLQERLKDLGKKSTGNKSDLIERLHSCMHGNKFVDDEAKEAEDELEDANDKIEDSSDDESVNILFDMLCVFAPVLSDPNHSSDHTTPQFDYR